MTLLVYLVKFGHIWSIQMFRYSKYCLW